MLPVLGEGTLGSNWNYLVFRVGNPLLGLKALPKGDKILELACLCSVLPSDAFRYIIMQQKGWRDGSAIKG